MHKSYGTSIMTDIRNFTGTFEKYQHQDSKEFLNFIEKYYKVQSVIANVISDELHMGTTGDGVLAIFTGENHYMEGFAYFLAVHRGLSKLCKEFEELTSELPSFGIGADSGNVWKVGEKKTSLSTYVGSVINRSARIEANTKLFGDTRASVGYFLYKKLIEKFYPASYEIMMEHEQRYDELLTDHPDVVLISQQFMLFYIFEMELSGIQEPMPIFRLSESMAKKDDKYWRIMGKLISEEKIGKLKKILK